MEIQNENIVLLTDLLPQYRSANLLYKQIAENFALNFNTQCRIADFYNGFNDVQAFEKAILNFLLSTDKEKQMQIIPHLMTEIDKNIEIYTTRKDFLDGIDTIKVCAGRYNPLHVEIEGQLKVTNKFWQKLTQVRNSLESASWDNDNIATQRLAKEEERLESLYRLNCLKTYRIKMMSNNYASIF